AASWEVSGSGAGGNFLLSHSTTYNCRGASARAEVATAAALRRGWTERQAISPSELQTNRWSQARTSPREVSSFARAEARSFSGDGSRPETGLRAAAS